jgi:NADP-dependent 3-hydroxy acid dehydrogenase YdfG
MSAELGVSVVVITGASSGLVRAAARLREGVIATIVSLTF